MVVVESRGLIPDQQFWIPRGSQHYRTITPSYKPHSSGVDSKEYCNLGLLAKIKSCLPSPYLELIKSYLEGRCFRVKARTGLSGIHPVMAGVPQGSILGPILFSLYTADIPVPYAEELDIDPRKMMVATFADDVGIFFSSHCEYEAADGIQEYLHRLGIWAKGGILK